MGLQQTNMSIDDQRLAYTAEWSQSLFGCFGDISTCAMGMCCAPCLYGQTSEIAEGDGCVKPCLLAYCCGPSCANCQEASELKSHNFAAHSDWTAAASSV